MTSRHYARERRTRQHIIDRIGEGHTILSVVWDRGHKNGAEVHMISDTGIISIYNQNSGKLITKLIARPGQIKRYFENGDAPVELLTIARRHTELGYNRQEIEQ